MLPNPMNHAVKNMYYLYDDVRAPCSKITVLSRSEGLAKHREIAAGHASPV